MDSLSLLQGIFPTQGLNPGLPHCRQILHQLSYDEKDVFFLVFVLEVLVGHHRTVQLLWGRMGVCVCVCVWLSAVAVLLKLSQFVNCTPMQNKKVKQFVNRGHRGDEPRLAVLHC